MHPSAESHHLPSTMPVRPFSWDDLPRWTVLYNTAFGLAATEGEFDEPEMRRHLSLPGLDPERDCFIARESGADAGLAILWPELPIRRAVLQMGVSGAHSPQAVEQALLDAAIERASGLPVDVLHTQIPSEDDAGHRTLCDAGFLPVRRYATMRWSGDALPNEDLPHDFTLRSFRTGYDDPKAHGYPERRVRRLVGLLSKHHRADRSQDSLEVHDPRRNSLRHTWRRRCRIQLDDPSRGARRQPGSHSHDRRPP